MKSLEQEFREYEEHHKYEIIVATLIKCADEGIYDERILDDYREVGVGLNKRQRSHLVANEIYDRYMNDEEEFYNEVYEMCWNRICNRIDDNKSYRVGATYDED